MHIWLRIISVSEEKTADTQKGLRLESFIKPIAELGALIELNTIETMKQKYNLPYRDTIWTVPE